METVGLVSERIRAMWEIIGWIGSGIVVISMLQQRIFRLRLVNLVGCLVSLAYAAAIGAWPLAGLNAALSAIQIWNLAKLWSGRHDPSHYDAVAVDPAGELVARLVQRHSEEIHSLNPAFTSPSASDDAFLVFTGDEVVGLVLARRDGTTARIDLDYVTAAYRDFTPGEFVFRRSGIWQARGIARIETAPGGPDYYASLGFVPTGGIWRLELAGSAS